MFAKRLSVDDTSRVRVYENNPNKLWSLLDRANRGSTLNLKITSWGNTPILKLNVVEFFLNAKRRHSLIKLHQYLLLNFVNSLNPDQA